MLRHFQRETGSGKGEAGNSCWRSVIAVFLSVGWSGLDAQSISNILPAPTGPAGIGRVTYHWVDSSRADRFSEARAGREVIVDIWYPARPARSTPTTSYLPDLAALRHVLGDSALRREFSPAYEMIEARRLRTHAVEGAPAACGRAACPVLVFSHGGGVDRSFYTVQYEELASHGYLVVAVAHPHLTHLVVMPDGRVIRAAPPPNDTTPPDLSVPVWWRGEIRAQARVRYLGAIAAADIRFVIDQLEKHARDATLSAPFVRHVDLTRIGVLGHSFGGEAAAFACQLDRRIGACLNQDGAVSNLPFQRDADGRTMRQPFMYITRFVELGTPPDSVLASMQMTRVEFDSLRRALPAAQDRLLRDVAGGAYRVTLRAPNVDHMSFSDEVLIRAAGDSARAADALVALRIINRYTRAFFDRTLRKRAETPLDRLSGADSLLVKVERFTYR